MPMVNNIQATQAGGLFQLSFPLTKSLSLALQQEDDFVNNAPKLKRKNYLRTGATISYTTAVRLKVEQNQLVDVFGEIGVLIDGLKGA
jgi:hypothetical protein